jgi:hypothetical protein
MDSVPGVRADTSSEWAIGCTCLHNEELDHREPVAGCLRRHLGSTEPIGRGKWGWMAPVTAISLSRRIASLRCPKGAIRTERSLGTDVGACRFHKAHTAGITRIAESH